MSLSSFFTLECYSLAHMHLSQRSPTTLLACSLLCNPVCLSPRHRAHSSSRLCLCIAELKAKAVNVSKEEKQVLLAEICRECGKAGDHWIDVADRLFVGYDHLPGMLHLSTMYPDEKKSALESNKKKQKSAAEAGVRFGFEGRHQEFVIAVQQCDSKLGGPAKARLVALPYSIFGGDMCPEGHGCPDGPACPKIHSPAACFGIYGPLMAHSASEHPSQQANTLHIFALVQALMHQASFSAWMLMLDRAAASFRDKHDRIHSLSQYAAR
eukprot:1160165-Pelagomonas_calceolata.AAC.6